MLMLADQAHGVLAPCTTSTDAGMVFGFNATRFVVTNDRASAVYCRFNSSAPSTDGYKTCSGESLVLTCPQTGVFSVGSTTTSTGTFVRVLALGG